MNEEESCCSAYGIVCFFIYIFCWWFILSSPCQDLHTYFNFRAAPACETLSFNEKWVEWVAADAALGQVWLKSSFFYKGESYLLQRSFRKTPRVLVSIYRYCFIKADIMPFGGWVERRETIELNDSRCLSFLRNSPPVPLISCPTSPLSLSLSPPLSLSYLHLPPPVDSGCKVDKLS